MMARQQAQRIYTILIHFGFIELPISLTTRYRFAEGSWKQHKRLYVRIRNRSKYDEKVINYTRKKVNSKH